MATKKIKLGVTDARMLQLIEELKAREVIRFTQAFCDAIGIKKQAIRQIKLGETHFTGAHIATACKAFKVDANYIVGLASSPFRENAPKAGLKQKIKQVKQ